MKKSSLSKSLDALLFQLTSPFNCVVFVTIICSQREPKSWESMIPNDENLSNAIIKRATKHFTVVIKPQIPD